MRILELIAKFLAWIPPQDEYISEQSRRYWLLREAMENTNAIQKLSKETFENK